MQIGFIRKQIKYGYIRASFPTEPIKGNFTVDKFAIM